MVRKKGDLTHRFTEEQLKLMEGLSAHGTPMEDIAAELGISKDTLERRMKDDKGIEAAIKKGRRRALINARKTLYEMAFVDKHVAAAIFYAKTQLRWHEPKQQIEISTPAGSAAPTIQFNLKGNQKLAEVEEHYLDKPAAKSEKDSE